jgi:hypothetical protein
MHRAAFSSFSHLRPMGAAVVILATVADGQLHAEEASSACRLLQVSELEAAIGGKASSKPSGTKQAVPGMSLGECSVVLTGSGLTHPVSIRIVTNIGMDGAQAVRIRNMGQASEPQW